MSKMNVIKAAAVIILGEAFAHYEVLQNGALMFDGQNSSLVVSKDKAYYTNLTDGNLNADVTGDFNHTVDILQEAENAEGDDALMLFGRMQEEIGAANFVDSADLLVEEHVVSTILLEKLLKTYPKDKVNEFAYNCYGLGEDSYVSHRDIDKSLQAEVFDLNPITEWEDLPF
jgi:hypothetical protein